MFGKRLAELRKKKKLSQYKLAELLKMTRGQIANYEQGKRQPDFETLQIFADFFLVSTDYLLGRTDDPVLPLEEEIEYEGYKMIVHRWIKEGKTPEKAEEEEREYKRWKEILSKL